MNSREKGKRGEREFVKLLKYEGYDVERGQQYCGLKGNADVVGLEGIYIEVKRRALKTLSGWLHKALCESLRRGEKELPIVAHRGDNEDWMVTMYFEHWIRLYQDWDGM